MGFSVGSGAPDYYDRSIHMGKYGTELIPIKLDADGQMFIAMTGQSLNVDNLPSDYFKAGEPVAVPGGVDVTNEPVIQGKDGATPHVVAVDSAGIILARMKGAYGATLKDISVDSNGIMLSRMKGAYGGVLKDISVDDNGVMISRMQGQYDGAAKDMALDVDGNMQAKMTGDYEGTPKEQAKMTGDYEGTPKEMAVDASGRMLAHLYGRNKIPFNMETFRHCNEISEIDSYTNVVPTKNAYAYIHGSGSLSLWTAAGNVGTTVFNKGSSHFNYFQYISFYYRVTGSPSQLQFRLQKDASNYLYVNLTVQNLWTLKTINIWNEMTEVGSCTPNDAVDIRFINTTSGANSSIGLDWIRSHFYSDMSDDPKPLQVNEYGGLPVYLYGLYEGSPVIINCDIDGNIKMNINNQDLPYQTSRIKYGANKVVSKTGVGYSGNTNHVILNITNNIGKLDGGSMYDDNGGGASAEDGYWRVTIDGVIVAQRTFKELYDSGIDTPEKGVVYWMSYDNTNKRFRVGFRTDMNYESSLKIEFYNASAATATLTGDINYTTLL